MERASTPISSECSRPARSTTSLGALLLAGDAARHAGGRHRSHGGSVAVVGLGPGDSDWITPQSAPRTGRRHRPHRLRPLSRPRRRPRPGQTPPPQRQHRRAGARPAGLQAGPAGPRGRGGVLGRSRACSRWRPRCSEEAERLARRAGAGDPGDDAPRRRSPAGSARRWATTTRSSRCPTGSSRGRSSPSGSARPRRAGPGAGDLQPGVEEPHVAGRRDAGPAAGAPRRRARPW